MAVLTHIPAPPPPSLPPAPHTDSWTLHIPTLAKNHHTPVTPHTHHRVAGTKMTLVVKTARNPTPDRINLGLAREAFFYNEFAPQLGIAGVPRGYYAEGDMATGEMLVIAECMEDAVPAGVFFGAGWCAYAIARTRVCRHKCLHLFTPTSHMFKATCTPTSHMFKPRAHPRTHLLHAHLSRLTP